MSATNKTTHYELPSFLGSDKPAWLVDWNGAMAAIDAAIYEAKQTADGAATQAATNASDISSLSTTVSGLVTDLGVVSTALTTLTGTVNTITSLIGNGEPTTTDKTLIGAINEINSNLNNISASDVPYDNDSSGLSGENVQDVIDEIASVLITHQTGTPLTTELVTNTYNNLSEIHIDKTGFYIIVASFLWSDSFSNFAAAALRLYSNGSYNVLIKENQSALDGNYANLVYVAHCEQDDDIVLSGYQESGSNKNVSQVSFHAIFVSE